MMQTFMPHDTYEESAWALDPARRRNQRNECKVILKTLLGLYPTTKTGRPGGWPHHPAVKMWAGYESALCRYALAVCQACLDDGWVNGDLTEFFEERLAELKPGGDPTWMGSFEFHESHRSNLVRKDPDYYGPKWPGTPDDLPYVWPEVP
jgi:hypothetical protein